MAAAEASRRRRWALWALLLLRLLHPAALVLANTEGTRLSLSPRFVRLALSLSCSVCRWALAAGGVSGSSALLPLDRIQMEVVGLRLCYRPRNPSAVSGVWLAAISGPRGRAGTSRFCVVRSNKVRIYSAPDSGVWQLAEPNKFVLPSAPNLCLFCSLMRPLRVCVFCC